MLVRGEVVCARARIPTVLSYINLWNIQYNATIYSENIEVTNKDLYNLMKNISRISHGTVWISPTYICMTFNYSFCKASAVQLNQLIWQTSAPCWSKTIEYRRERLAAMCDVIPARASLWLLRSTVRPLRWFHRQLRRLHLMVEWLVRILVTHLRLALLTLHLIAIINFTVIHDLQASISAYTRSERDNFLNSRRWHIVAALFDQLFACNLHQGQVLVDDASAQFHRDGICRWKFLSEQLVDIWSGRLKKVSDLTVVDGWKQRLNTYDRSSQHIVHAQLTRSKLLDNHKLVTSRVECNHGYAIVSFDEVFAVKLTWKIDKIFFLCN